MNIKCSKCQKILTIEIESPSRDNISKKLIKHGWFSRTRKKGYLCPDCGWARDFDNIKQAILGRIKKKNKR